MTFVSFVFRFGHLQIIDFGNSFCFDVEVSFYIWTHALLNCFTTNTTTLTNFRLTKQLSDKQVRSAAFLTLKF